MFLVNPLKSSEKYVYHYTKLETASKYILKTGMLRLNSFSRMNDPRESKNWTIITTVKANLNLDLKEWDALSDSVSNALKQNVKVVCFSKDSASAVNKWQPEGLLDRGFVKPNMWHHYSNGHNGVCLVFDIEKLDASFKKQINKEKLFSDSVSYSDEGIVPNCSNYPFSVDLTKRESEQQLLEYLSIHLNQWLPNLFFKKLKDWSNEEEYRWVYFDDHADPICLTFDDALEAIVVGDRVSKDYNNMLLMYCAKYEADIVNLEWRNGYPTLFKPGSPYITHKHLLEDLDSD